LPSPVEVEDAGRRDDAGRSSGAMDDGAIEVVVEIPKGSRNKYEFDH